jgi:hypothetical protein
MTTTALPRSLQSLVDDATARGWTVKVTQDENSVEVWIEHETANVAVGFTKTPVWDTPLSAERLGFRTTEPARYTLRFTHSTGWTKFGGYTVPRSVRQARGVVGLPV